MVLEYWFEKKNVLPSTLEIIAQSIIFVTIALGGVYLIGLQQSNVAFVFLVGLPAIPFLLRIFQTEVEDEEKREKFLGSGTLARHYNALRVLAAFFLGMVLAFTFWYLVLPIEDRNVVFELQRQELKNIQGVFSGSVQGLAISEGDAFNTIFTHNIQVLMFVIIFSLVYGAGSVFILIWNASVIGAFLGEFSRAYVFNGGGSLVGGIGRHFTGVGLGLLGILPHGVFELLGYVTAALAGGILSASIVRGDYKQKIFVQITYDIAKLLAWAVIFVAVGAFLESYPKALM